MDVSRWKIGCDDFLSVYANIDVLKTKIPLNLMVEGRQVRVRVFRKEGFDAVYRKVATAIEGDFIGKATLDNQDSAFLLIVCKEDPLVVKAYKLINKPPPAEGIWNISGGLKNFSGEKGLGTRLMQATEALGNMYNIERIQITSVLSAVGFYENFGMRQITYKVLDEEEGLTTDDAGIDIETRTVEMIKRIGVRRGGRYFTTNDIRRGALMG